MSYKGIKRVLGETSLERKCRFLFGACLLVLISGVFYWVENNAEQLVRNNIRGKGRNLVDMYMLETHFKAWETNAENKKLVLAQIDEMDRQKKDTRFFVLRTQNSPIVLIDDDDPERTNYQVTEASEEYAVMQRLAEKIANKRKKSRPTNPLDSPGDTLEDVGAPEEPEPIFEDLVDRTRGKYYYYEPLEWTATCATCHFNVREAGGLSETEDLDGTNDQLPLRVVKVELPYKPTQDAILFNRSVLATTAIITVVVAMLALYIIVRYVIVKPLQHLREVSDAISHGDWEERAEIHTNDEFEDLGASFNRMLRHLIEAHQELKHLNRDLDSKVDELAQANVQLYETNRVKGDFLANMSHELRTPLNSIIGFSDVLQGLDSLTDKQKRYARNIQKSGRLLLELINDILDLAKLDADRMEVKLSEFHIGSVIAIQCDLVRTLTDEKNIALEMQVQEDAPALYQDQVKVQQILTNLISNAIKFTPEGGRITVSGSMEKNGMLKLSVADTGVGIAEEDREVIFEKFRQSKAVTGEDGLTKEFSGTGLGLSIVKEICKLLGGGISLESELGKGSTFTVRLPWTSTGKARRDREIDDRIHDLTKSKRLNYTRASQTPAPP